MAPGHYGEIERISRWIDAGGNARTIQHRKVTRRKGKQLRRTQTLGEVGLARVGDATGWQRIEGVGGTRHWREVAINVEDHIGGVGDVHTDLSAAARRHDGGIGLDAAIKGVHGRNKGLVFARGPDGQISQRAMRHYCDIQRVGSGSVGNVAAALLRNREGPRVSTLNRTASLTCVNQAARGDRNELQRLRARNHRDRAVVVVDYIDPVGHRVERHIPRISPNIYGDGGKVRPVNHRYAGAVVVGDVGPVSCLVHRCCVGLPPGWDAGDLKGRPINHGNGIVALVGDVDLVGHRVDRHSIWMGADTYSIGVIGWPVDHRYAVAVEVGHEDLVSHRIDCQGTRGITNRDGHGIKSRLVDHRHGSAAFVGTADVDLVGYRIPCHHAGPNSNRYRGGGKGRPVNYRHIGVVVVGHEDLVGLRVNPHSDAAACPDADEGGGKGRPINHPNPLIARVGDVDLFGYRVHCQRLRVRTNGDGGSGKGRPVDHRYAVAVVIGDVGLVRYRV